MFSFLIVPYLLCSHRLWYELCPLNLIVMHQNVCKTVVTQSNKASYIVRSELAAPACDSFTELQLQKYLFSFSSFISSLSYPRFKVSVY